MQWNTSFTWVASFPLMPQSARILTTACPKQVVPWKAVKKSMAESRASPLHKDPGIQGRRRSHPPVRCRDLGSPSEANQTTGAVLPTLLALHPRHQMARLRVKLRSPQESQPAQHRVHLAPSEATLGWRRLKDGRRSHAQSNLLRRAPRRKA